MITLKLPPWLNGQTITTLKESLTRWWDKVERWINWPLTQMDTETCAMGILDLLAWQRDITRFHAEPEWLYRKRIKFAVANAKDAGSTAGIKRIFIRLGVGYVEVEERVPGRDWDVIQIKLTDSQLSENPELLRILLEMYGRTCRRYEFTLVTFAAVSLSMGQFDENQSTTYCKLAE